MLSRYDYSDLWHFASVSLILSNVKYQNFSTDCREQSVCPKNSNCHSSLKICIPSIDKNFCKSNKDCIAPSICSKGQCRRTCKGNRNCPNTQFCRKGFCKPKPDKKNRCSITEECSFGYICHSKKKSCVPWECRRDVDCRTGNSCDQGICIPGRRTCGAKGSNRCKKGEICKNKICVRSKINIIHPYDTNNFLLLTT